MGTTNLSMNLVMKINIIAVSIILKIICTKGMQTHVNENIIAYEIKTVVVTNEKITYFCIGKS